MLQIRKSSSSAPVRILYQRMDMCHLACTGSAAAGNMHSGRRAVTVGSIPADRRRGNVDLPCCSLRAHCSSARRSPPATDHNYPLLMRAARPRTQRGDVTCRLGNRRAYRGVNIPAQRVNGQSMLCFGHAYPTYPHLMR
jgi:hypothetical protein